MPGIDYWEIASRVFRAGSLKDLLRRLGAANLLLNGLRNRLIVLRLHGVHATALRTGTQRGGVTKHLGERNQRVDLFGRAVVIHAFDAAAAAVQVADNVAHVLFRNRNVNLHDRLKQHRIGLGDSSLESHRTGDLKRDFRGVNIVVRTVVYGNVEVNDFVATQRAVLGSLADTGIDRRDEFLRNGAADGVVAEGVAFAGRDRGDLDPAVTELAMAAGLATLRQLRQMDYDALERRVSAFAGELRAILSAKGVPIQMPTIASMFCPYFSEQEVVDFATAKQCDQQLFTTFYKQMRQQGIFLAPSGFETGMVSFAHTDDDFNKALDAARKVSF